MKKLVFLALLLVVGIASGAIAAEKDDDSLRNECEAALQKEDYVSAGKLLTILHQRGDSQATYVLAELYLSGSGVPQDSAKAIAMLRNLANGYSSGMRDRCNLRLGEIYETGDGVDVNLDEAAKYYWEGAGNGVIEAAAGIARIYKGDKGISMLSSALRNAEEHYDKRMIISCAFALGLIYEEGFGTDADLLKAVGYYWKAANADDNNAVAKLAEIYRGGKVVSTDWKGIYEFSCGVTHLESWQSLCAVAKDHMTAAQIREAKGEVERREEARGAAAAQSLYNQVMAE